jgi:hypothetical protein
MNQEGRDFVALADPTGVDSLQRNRNNSLAIHYDHVTRSTAEEDLTLEVAVAMLSASGRGGGTILESDASPSITLRPAEDVDDDAKKQDASNVASDEHRTHRSLSVATIGSLSEDFFEALSSEYQSPPDFNKSVKSHIEPLQSRGLPSVPEQLSHSQMTSSLSQYAPPGGRGSVANSFNSLYDNIPPSPLDLVNMNDAVESAAMNEAVTSLSMMSRTPPYHVGGTVQPSSYELSHFGKRIRSDSISSRLRTASEYLDDHGILTDDNANTKAILKDLVIIGDKDLQHALDRYEYHSDPSALEDMLLSGALEERLPKDLDILGDLDLDFLAFAVDNKSRESINEERTERRSAETQVSSSRENLSIQSMSVPFQEESRVPSMVSPPYDDGIGDLVFGGDFEIDDHATDDFRPFNGHRNREPSQYSEKSQKPFADSTQPSEYAGLDIAETAHRLRALSSASTSGIANALHVHNRLSTDEYEERMRSNSLFSALLSDAPTSGYYGSFNAIRGHASAASDHSMADESRSAVSLTYAKNSCDPDTDWLEPYHSEGGDDLSVENLDEEDAEMGMIKVPLDKASRSSNLQSQHLSPCSSDAEDGSDVDGHQSRAKSTSQRTERLKKKTKKIDDKSERRLQKGGERKSVDDSSYLEHVPGSGRPRSLSDPLLKTSVDDEGFMQVERPDGWIGAYSPSSRLVRIARYLEKRSKRVWTKTVKYDVRKNFADSRLRVKGRFVKKEDETLMRELMSLS